MSKQSNNERIEKWIETIEQKANLLISGADLEDLSSKERIELGLRCINTMQRFIVLSQQIEAETPTGSTSIMLAAIMRQMRGEIDIPTIESEQESEG
jgi:hypothetical protein